MQDDAATAAGTAATEAARAAGVAIVDLRELADLEQMSALLDDVWGRDPAAGAILAPELLRAMEHAGCQITAAFRDQRMVAATAALIGFEHGHVHLHSHITGVRPDAQARGVGWAMKQYQRAWALARGITTVRWTFDPLVRRNAVFNLVKLGARPVAYLENVYGRMQDEVNRGLPTDRAVAEWQLAERRVAMASEGRFAEPRLDALRGAGAIELLRDEDGEPVRQDGSSRHLLVQVPPDIERMRAEDLDRAARWAEALRGTLGTALGAGYRVTGITRDGWYVLAADQSVEELV